MLKHIIYKIIYIYNVYLMRGADTNLFYIITGEILIFRKAIHLNNRWIPLIIKK